MQWDSVEAQEGSEAHFPFKTGSLGEGRVGRLSRPGWLAAGTGLWKAIAGHSKKKELCVLIQKYNKTISKKKVRDLPYSLSSTVCCQSLHVNFRCLPATLKLREVRSL
jgi:hypothetical protein